MEKKVEEPNESRLLYRILAFPSAKEPRRQIDEGNGLQGLQCRALHLNHETMSDFRQDDLGLVRNHIEENPDITPWISTSTNLSFLEERMEESLLNFSYYPEIRHLVIIDPLLLDTATIDLTDQKVQEKVLVDEKSLNYAKYWKEVLIYEQVPIKAILSSRQYFLSNDGIFYFKETPNSQYKFPKDI